MGLLGSFLPARPVALPTAASSSPVASPSDQASETARLRHELDRTRMERDVLKNELGPDARLWR